MGPTDGWELSVDEPSATLGSDGGARNACFRAVATGSVVCLITQLVHDRVFPPLFSLSHRSQLHDQPPEMKARRGEGYHDGSRPAASRRRMGAYCTRKSFFSATQHTVGCRLTSRSCGRPRFLPRYHTGSAWGQNGLLVTEKEGGAETERRVGVCSSIIGG